MAVLVVGASGERRGGEMGGVMNGRGTRGAESAGAETAAGALAGTPSSAAAAADPGTAGLVTELKKSSNASGALLCVATGGWTAGGGGFAKEVIWAGGPRIGAGAGGGGGASGVIGLETGCSGGDIIRGIDEPDADRNGAATGASAGDASWSSSSANGSNGSSAAVLTLDFTGTGTRFATGAAENVPISPLNPSSYGLPCGG